MSAIRLKHSPLLRWNAATKSGCTSYVLLIDDDRKTRSKLSKLLKREVGATYEVKAAESAATALKWIRRISSETISIIAVSLGLGGSDPEPSLKLISKIRELFQKSSR